MIETTLSTDVRELHSAPRPTSWVPFLYVFVCLVVIAEALISFLVGLDTERGSSYTRDRRLLLAAYVSVAGVIILREQALRRSGLLSVRLSKLLFLGVLFLVLSLVANATLPTTLVLAAPLFATFVFGTLSNVSLSFRSRWFAVPLVLFSVTPILLFILIPQLKEGLVFFDDTFRGFGGSRTDFGYLLGLSVLLVWCHRSRTAKMLLPLLSYGIWLTESRATMTALIAAVAVTLWYATKAYRPWMLLTSVLATAVSLVNLPSVRLIDLDTESLGNRRGNLFLDTGSRAELYKAAFDQSLRQGPFFGAGRFYVPVNRNGRVLEAHNAVIQSILNFGVVTTLIWYLLTLSWVSKLSPQGKAFVVFFLVFGLFQPGFEAWFFSPVVFFTLLLAAHFSQTSASGPPVLARL